MKKLILSSAAMIMAFSFSAIAGTPENNKSEAKPVETKTKSENVECYRAPNGTFHVKLSGGICLEQIPNEYCSYTYDGPGVAGEDQNELHYTPDPNTANSRWQP